MALLTHLLREIYKDVLDDGTEAFRGSSIGARISKKAVIVGSIHSRLDMRAESLACVEQMQALFLYARPRRSKPGEDIVAIIDTRSDVFDETRQLLQDLIAEKDTES